MISTIFTDHDSVELEIIYKKKDGKITNMWKLKNMLLKSQWVNEEIKGEIKKYMEINENENMKTHIYGMPQKQYYEESL